MNIKGCFTVLAVGVPPESVVPPGVVAAFRTGFVLVTLDTKAENWRLPVSVEVIG
jgi:hypothetical protein